MMNPIARLMNDASVGSNSSPPVAVISTAAVFVGRSRSLGSVSLAPTAGAIARSVSDSSPLS